MHACPKPCEAGKICNPASGRCVNTSGKIGSALLGKSSLPAAHSDCPKGCPKSKICNPRSNRCVLKNGKIGSGLLAAKPTTVKSPKSGKREVSDDRNNDRDDDAIPEHKEIKTVYKSLLDKFIPGYDLVKQLGKGRYGIVYLMCKDRYNCRAVKVIKLESKFKKDEFVEEAKMQQKFASLGIAPKLYKYEIIDEVGLMEMEVIAGTLETLLKKPLPQDVLDRIVTWCGDLIEVLCSNDLIHGDMHWDNIGFNLVVTSPHGTEEAPKIGIQLLPLDFGMSCCVNKKATCIPELELSQMIRTLTLGNMNKANEDYLRERLLEIYRHNFNPNLEDSSKAFDKEYDNYWELYEFKYL